MATLLIVDDNPDMTTILSRAAELAGHRVITAADGSEAIGVVMREEVDLIVLDLVMPVMDGLEALGVLRDAKSGFKILAMSGGGRVGAEDYLRIARILGADRSLAKPFTTQEFLRTVDELLAPL